MMWKPHLTKGKRDIKKKLKIIECKRLGFWATKHILIYTKFWEGVQFTKMNIAMTSDLKYNG